MISDMNDSSCEKAIAIIHNTQDGDLLSPSHLKLTEMAVNGLLNDRGVEAFNKLYEEVISGEYKQPFFHDVEYMTQNHEGYILFKGKEVEHYSIPWAYSADAKNSLIKLQMQCLFLESKGITPSPSSCVWHWNFDDEYGEYKKAELDILLAANKSKILFSEITADNNNCQIVSFYMSGNPDEAMIYASNDYIDFMEHNGDNGGKNYSIQSVTFSYGNGESRGATKDEL
jgi:hypothetical protein